MEKYKHLFFFLFLYLPALPLFFWSLKLKLSFLSNCSSIFFFLFATNSQIAWWLDIFNISSFHIYVCMHTHTHTHTYIYRTCMCVLNCFSHVQLFATLWTIVHRLLCPWDSPRQEYWSGLPFPSPGDFPKPPGVQPPSLMSPALAGRLLYR